MSSMAPSTIRALILVVIVSQAVVFVVTMIDFDPPMDFVTVGFNVLATGAGLYMLRNPPEPREFGPRHRDVDDEG
jgi:hypothetical protein